MAGTATDVSFRGSPGMFPSAKEAYLWLVEQFRTVVPNLLENESEKPYINTGYGKRHFARSVEALYEKSPHLAESSNNYAELSGGWFADVILDNEKKVAILDGLSTAAGLQRNRDWTWDVDPPGDLLVL